MDAWLNMNRNAFRNTPVVGVEDGSFKKGITQKAILVAVLLKRLRIEKVKITKITVDGLDATERLAKTIEEWDFKTVMLAGVSFAGFNIIDPTIIYAKFGKPVIVISRTKPNNKAVKQALKQHFEDWQIRWDIFKKLGSIYRINVVAGLPPLYIETAGIRVERAKKMIEALSVFSRIPEPIRVARLIARGLS